MVHADPGSGNAATTEIARELQDPCRRAGRGADGCGAGVRRLGVGAAGEAALWQKRKSPAEAGLSLLGDWSLLLAWVLLAGLVALTALLATLAGVLRLLAGLLVLPALLLAGFLVLATLVLLAALLVLLVLVRIVHGMTSLLVEWNVGQLNCVRVRSVFTSAFLFQIASRGLADEVIE